MQYLYLIQLRSSKKKLCYKLIVWCLSLAYWHFSCIFSIGSWSLVDCWSLSTDYKIFNESISRICCQNLSVLKLKGMIKEVTTIQAGTSTKRVSPTVKLRLKSSRHFNWALSIMSLDLLNYYYLAEYFVNYA